MTEKWTTIKIASGLLDRTPRTLHRWIAEGKLKADKTERPMLVDIRPHYQEEKPDTRETTEALRVIVSELRSERDYLRQELDKSQDNVTRLTVTLANQTDRLLTAPKPRRWRWFWQRD